MKSLIFPSLKSRKMSTLRLRSILNKQASPTMLLRTPTPHSLTLLHFTSKPLFPKTLHFSRLYTSSPAISATQLETPPSPHPWPEWVAFVDRLKSRGYFPPASAAGGSEGELVYREMALLKDPCLSFARDRFDIFQSLSKGDLQNIVEVGCPKIVRKVVNSAKRLRLYVGLEEKNVCDACSLRSSCDRAFLVPNESEGAQTVDVMRLLLFYALDPKVISEAVRSPSVEQAGTSARRLLNMMMDLSEVSTSTAPVKPSVKPSYKQVKSVDSTDALPSQDVELREGDWVCPKCTFMNFSKNKRCWKCKTPSAGDIADVELKEGDWNCPQCGCMNFASRTNCFRCKDPRPPETLNPGEWVCSKCDYLNFKRNASCLKCGIEHRNPGDWVCSKCDYLNFKRNTTCRECGSEDRKEPEVQQNHIWRKPTRSVAT